MTPAQGLPFVIKICGITEEDDARVSIDAGANALGFNFYPPSPRYLSPARAREIIETITEPFLKVGVFVDPTFERLLETVASLQLDVVQIYGADCSSGIPQDCQVWRACAVSETALSGNGHFDAYLLDAATPQYGGSGEMFDWDLAADFPDPKIIAGGLNAENVAAAIEKMRPWGVDACSRLEWRPGKKDAAKVRDFVAAAVAAFTR